MKLALTIARERIDALWTPPNGTIQRRTYLLSAAAIGDELTAVLGAIATEMRPRGGVRLRIALMPPLVAMRRVELPPMADAERRLVIARQAERWFLSPRAPLAIAHRVLRRARKGPSRVLVAAASEALLNTIYSSVEAQGWTVDAVIPAQIAWMAFALEQWPAIRKGHHAIVATTAHERQHLDVVDAVLQLVRRQRLGDAKAFSLDGATVRSLDDATVAALNGAAKRRSFASARMTRLELVTEARRARDARRVKKHSNWLYAAAVAFCLGAAGLRFVGVHRELAAVRGARDAQRSRVQQTMTLRDSLAAVTAELDELGRLETQSPHWSSVIAHIAAKLPDDAHLVGLHAVGDSLILDGQAQDAAKVFALMHDAPGLSSVSPAAPIRQEVVPGQPTVEHWTMAARVEAK